jgi:hypothetical protein
MKRYILSALTISTSFLMILMMPLAAKAASTVVVTPPVNSQGWSTNDTTPDGNVSFVTDSSAPGGVGALQLTTSASVSSKAQYFHSTNTPLANITDLSYYTKQVSASFAEGAPAYEMPTLLNGTSGFTTLVFEPYQNPTQGPVVNNVWQQWDVDAGLFWSTRTVTCSNGTIVGTQGGPASYTLEAITATCPNAVVQAFGPNIGSNNPLYTVRTDLFNFNGTVYDFEPYAVASDKDQCKNGGWQTYKDASGNGFKNQGDCVSYVATHGKNSANG